MHPFIRDMTPLKGDFLSDGIHPKLSEGTILFRNYYSGNCLCYWYLDKIKEREVMED